MRRVLATVATAALLLAGGCGGRSYEVRLDKTLEAMRYKKRLDDNLAPAPTKGKLEQNLIFIRPPKGLDGPANEFTLVPALEPDKFDVADTFFEKGKQTMHVLARVKRPKGPANKKGAAPEAPKAERHEFVPDVIELLNSAYSLELDPAKAKEESKKQNKFRHLTFEANGKNVQVYFYGNKTSVYELALIFEYPKSEQANLVSKIELCLESFATGEKARRAFSGTMTEEEGGEAGAGGAPVAF